MHQHVHGEQQALQRACSLRVDQEFGNGDGAARRQRRESSAEQGLASCRALAVQDMAKERNVMARSEIRFEEISGDEPVARCQTVPIDDTLGDRQDACPVDGRHFNPWRLLGERAPNAGPGRQVQHTHRIGGTGNGQMFSQRARAAR
jgi:hypothetical protein